MNSRTIVNMGVQNFDKLRERDSFYIDKTGFIREWWEGGAEVTLITRPRRFGKTLNMSMLECFFSTKYAGRGDLFEGLDIWKDERYRQLQGTYPVIFLSFAGIKAVNADDMKYKMTEVISNLYDENTYLLEGDTLTSNEKEYYQSIKPGVDDKIIAGTVQRMARFLSRYYGKKRSSCLTSTTPRCRKHGLAATGTRLWLFFGVFLTILSRRIRICTEGL